MIEILKKLLTAGLERGSENPVISTDLATAILLLETAAADFQHDDSETAAIKALLLDHLSLQQEEVDELIAHARREADRLVSLQHLTRMMNETMQQQEKIRVIELMWRVVYADGEKHHYEEHLLRQVADLLYVSHGDFIQARHRAESST